ncbi:TPA: hypothetical protein ACGYPC_000663 [Enterococcus faecium]
MQITIPDNLVVSELTTQITNAVLNSLDERLHLMNKSVELPPYPNKSEVRKVLGIGDDSKWTKRDLGILKRGVNWLEDQYREETKEK